MPTIHLNATTTATPEQVLASLVDFGPGRSEIFSNSADDYLEVHSQGAHEADVTEGSGGIWERLHYDWSDPRRVVMTTTDSNIWGGRSGHVYTLTPLAEGGTRIDAVVVREGKNLKGRIVGALLASVGKGVLTKALRSTATAVGSRNEGIDSHEQ
ncbi:SRPBCC family protein [Mumia sp. DW29H23]|uniref:SRPBCC family protein n=1 Tax=Mumia sp. DW29H23 TaxID=3421241 RepID=UPI003D6950F6